MSLQGVLIHWIETEKFRVRGDDIETKNFISTRRNSAGTVYRKWTWRSWYHRHRSVKTTKTLYDFRQIEKNHQFYISSPSSSTFLGWANRNTRRIRHFIGIFSHHAHHKPTPITINLDLGRKTHQPAANPTPNQLRSTSNHSSIGIQEEPATMHRDTTRFVQTHRWSQ